VRKRELFLLGAYGLFIFTPILVGWIVINEPRSFWPELAGVLGMLAYALIISEFLTSGRNKRLSRTLGMDTSMRVHRLVGWVILIAAILHPFMYGSTPSDGPRPWDATLKEWVSPDFSGIATGVLALVLLPALVVMAVWRSALDYRYEVWRGLHAVLAIVIVLLLLHHTISAGRYGRLPEVTLVWYGLVFLAVGSIVYRWIWVPFAQSRKPWTIASVKPLSKGCWSLTLSPEGHSGLDYEAGQFAWIKLDTHPLTLHENPFSIASAPASGNDISFIIKELGDRTSTLAELQIGARAYVDGAYGSLRVTNRREPGIALIAGGVGIAPMMGILRQLRETKDPRAVRILYGNRRADQIHCRDELDAESCVYVISEPAEGWEGETGLIDAKLLERTFSQSEFDEWLFVVCGPNPMMDSVKTNLVSRGVSGRRILLERFNYD